MGRGVALCGGIKGFARLGDELGESHLHVFLVSSPVSGFHPQVKKGTPHAGADSETSDLTWDIGPETLGLRVTP